MNIEAVNQFIGTPWVYRENDCWAVFKKASKAVFDVDIYDIEIPEKSDMDKNASLFNSGSEDSRWQKVEKPSNGCAVLFKNRRGVPIHIGLHVINGDILHCPGTPKRPFSTMYEHIKTLRLQFPIIEFYEYNDNK